MDLPHLMMDPEIPESCYIDVSSRINGDVRMGEHCSVWFNVSIRGDVHRIRLGEYTNIQDNCVLHTTHKKFPLTLGNRVTFGHGVIAHGCSISDCVFVGMQSLILDGAEISNHVMIGAGSLITEKKKIPSGVLVFGRPAKVIRDLTPDELKLVETHPMKYSAYAETYREAGLFSKWSNNPHYRSPNLK